jgi:Family of unknown function (DUF6152)
LPNGRILVLSIDTTLSLANTLNGNVQKWFIEMTAPNHLVHFGWNGHKLHAGDEITVTDHAAKNGNKTLNLSKIYAANGQEIPLGAPPADAKTQSSSY